MGQSCDFTGLRRRTRILDPPAPAPRARPRPGRRLDPPVVGGRSFRSAASRAFCGSCGRRGLLGCRLLLALLCLLHQRAKNARRCAEATRGLEALEHLPAREFWPVGVLFHRRIVPRGLQWLAWLERVRTGGDPLPLPARGAVVAASRRARCPSRMRARRSSWYSSPGRLLAGRLACRLVRRRRKAMARDLSRASLPKE